MVPRVLQTKKESSGEEESEEEETTETTKPIRDEFVANPEELRAKAEQRRQQQFQSRGRRGRPGPPPKERDVVGEYENSLFSAAYILPLSISLPPACSLCPLASPPLHPISFSLPTPC